jgi:GalNAc-alpha-(1->4)-GalNAc-alpha-(1->3)-diNAcBac-PP-undecaprenol alpha-1,4-N-acetyl-D-galactosaminyltransferase
MPTQQQSNEFPKRVMFVIHSMRGGGSERQMSYLANEIASHAQTSLVTLDETGNDAYPIDPRIERLGLKLTSNTGGLFRGAVANIRRISSLRRQIRTWQPDVVVSFCDSTNILSLMACPSNIPVLISERSDPRRQTLSRIWEFMRKKYYPKCQVCVTQTKEVGEHIVAQTWVASSKVVVIPSAIRIPDLSLENLNCQRAMIQPKTLIFVGRLSKEKRLDRLLNAWANLTEHHSAWRLQIVGDGLERASLQRLAAELNLEQSVQWSLWSDDVWSSLNAAHAYCLVSDYEGFPQSMLEAMASGLPVAVLDCSPAIRQTISDEVDGIVIPSLDLISSTLHRMLSSDSLREALGRAAFRRARDFEWSAIAPQWLAAIASLRIDFEVNSRLGK